MAAASLSHPHPLLPVFRLNPSSHSTRITMAPVRDSKQLHHSAQTTAAFYDLYPPYDPAESVLPLYGRRPLNSTTRSPFPCQTPPPAYEDEDYMRTVDRRHYWAQNVEQLPKYNRSSFALSDIFELDEDDVEIEILEVVPASSLPSASSSPTESTSSWSFSAKVPGKNFLRRVTSFTSSTSESTNSVKSLKGIVGRILTKLSRAGPHGVDNNGTNTGLDLFTC